MNYISKLKKAIKNYKTHLVVGLDSDIKKIPSFFLKYSNPVLEFNKAIIDVTKNNVAGYKINTAFYEAEGAKGFETLSKTTAYIPDDHIKICDAKRGDIGNTAELYSKAYLNNLNFDAITLNPYMGFDSVEPYIRSKNKYVYIIALTSNQGHKDFQLLKSNRRHLYEIVIDKFLQWSRKDNIGFVMGANHVKEISTLTRNHPRVSLLIPGIGAQGNDINKLMDNIHNGLFIVNSSRAIIYSAGIDSDKKEFESKINESIVNHYLMLL
ncbi:orotidine-5'-phosphate decarboxylase [bacterium]|nr:MAG: orotidine-5'-phosphate decarboxylase [bacterium]